MIPTVILFGLLCGRWWKSGLVAGTLGWPLFLLANDILHSPQEVLGALGLGFVNTFAGVAVHQLALSLVRTARKRRATQRGIAPDALSAANRARAKRQMGDCGTV